MKSYSSKRNILFSLLVILGFAALGVYVAQALGIVSLGHTIDTPPIPSTSATHMYSASIQTAQKNAFINTTALLTSGLCFLIALMVLKPSKKQTMSMLAGAVTMLLLILGVKYAYDHEVFYKRISSGPDNTSNLARQNYYHLTKPNKTQSDKN